MKTTDYIKEWLKKNLSNERYNHSLGCAETARELAKKYGEDENKAYLAGLVHDCAKNMDNKRLLEIIQNEIKIGYDETEIKNPKTYHAIVAPYLAKKEFEIEDNTILQAIRHHTIGSTSMTLFDKIIFLADKIEPNTRDKEYSSKLTKFLDDSEQGLNKALLVCYCETIKSLVERGLYICPITIDVYNQLLENAANCAK